MVPIISGTKTSTGIGTSTSTRLNLPAPASALAISVIVYFMGNILHPTLNCVFQQIPLTTKYTHFYFTNLSKNPIAIPNIHTRSAADAGAGLRARNFKLSAVLPIIYQ